MWIFSEDPGCSRFIKEYGEYSPGEMAFMNLWLNKDSVVVDAGANIGGLTLPLASMAKKVYAFEPQDEVAYLLKSNTQNRSNVEVIQCGLGDKECTMKCGPETSGWGPDSVGSFALSTTEGTEKVQVKTLDSFNLAPTLIKVDVEGMEVQVLAGAQETIKKHRPFIWMERSVPAQVLDRVFSFFGYRYCNVDIPIWVPNNYNNNPVDIHPGMAHLSTFAYPCQS